MGEERTTITVTLINRGQGSVVVHKQGCADLARMARGASIWDVEAQSFGDIVQDVYPPDEFDYDDWEEVAGDIIVSPCARPAVKSIPRDRVEKD